MEKINKDPEDFLNGKWVVSDIRWLLAGSEYNLRVRRMVEEEITWRFEDVETHTSQSGICFKGRIRENAKGKETNRIQFMFMPEKSQLIIEYPATSISEILMNTRYKEMFRIEPDGSNRLMLHDIGMCGTENPDHNRFSVILERMK